MCDWLPELFEFNDYDGHWATYLEAIHEQFSEDFERSRPTWPEKRFSLKRHPEHDGKSATFWHLISEGSVENERTPDFRRCERIAWPRSIIDRFPNQPPNNSDKIKWWRNRRGRNERILIALSDFSYLVVMADRGEYIMLWTAYPVAQTHQKRKLEREYVRYWRDNQS